VKSAMEIATSIDIERYLPIYVGITRSGVWKICERPVPDWEDGCCRRAVVSPDRETHGLIAIDAGGCQLLPVDAVFPVLHGKSGEDGAVQGLLELSGIPYVGCDVQSSAICMDKSLAYVVARSAGIETPEFFVVDGTPVPEGLAFPAYVKPARSGSSFGVTKVERAADLAAAISAARRYDRKVVIERAVHGTEVGCAVLGNGSRLFTGDVDQIELRHGIFRIHQEAEPEKGSENAVVTVPAAIPAAQREEVKATAKAVYMALGCRGLSRVDMFLRTDGRIILNEVNTMPGFTSYSRYPRMMAAAGIGLSELIDRCIALAMGR
jgi:D-alanine---(R)-lactate ligase